MQVTQHLQVTRRNPEEWTTIGYRIPLIKSNGEVEKMIAFLIKDITAELPRVDVGPIITLFRGIKLQDITYPTGHGWGWFLLRLKMGQSPSKMCSIAPVHNCLVVLPKLCGLGPQQGLQGGPHH